MTIRYGFVDVNRLKHPDGEFWCFEGRPVARSTRNVRDINAMIVSVDREGFRNPIQVNLYFSGLPIIVYGISRCIVADTLGRQVPAFVNDELDRWTDLELIMNVDDALAKFKDTPQTFEFKPNWFEFKRCMAPGNRPYLRERRK